MGHPSAAGFQLTAQAAQQAAGIIAARHRGEFADAETLISGLDAHRLAVGSLFLAELAVSLLASSEGRSIDEVAADLSLQIAAHAPSTGD